MHEERHADRGEVTVTVVTITIAPQRVPRTGRNGIRRRSNGEDVKDRVFAVGIPARLEETCFRFPAVREQERMTIEHPAKVNAVVNPSGQASDLSIAREALLHSENARQQQCGVN